MVYNNAVLTITDISTPDPHVTFVNGVFHLVYTAGDRVEIWSSQDLLQLGQTCNKTTVWRPPPNTPYSADIWAPELHAINGRWYIYVACADPQQGNKSHRMYVLGGPPADADPNGQFEMLGPVAGLPSTQWQIDGTIFPINDRLYFAYSGWPLEQRDASEKTQELFIVEMSDATTAISQPVQICVPNESWERSGDSGVNEGPQFLSSPHGNWIGLAYSCAGSWTKDYKMNTLYYSGGDPLACGSWHKSRRPLIQNAGNGRAGPFGPGHGSFVNVNGETWAVYHATDREDQGWDGRKARVQRVLWGTDGPEMGGCVGTLVREPGVFISGAGCESSGGNGPAVGEGGKKHGIKDIMKEAKGFLKNL
ncbi:glycoside hydrolase family protein [Venturia nashicola]|uniref:Glycoside hydrolase family 43 protein n=1 Tax=Venturia nashicola TaxID=86259 RepID=A0A4Z1P779_9PEZI|nr:glycoside hydrolase family 43 protein [Venturia nashicola]TLD37290.1 glycoside hydrolase family protein [Venturia nashicola]